MQTTAKHSDSLKAIFQHIGQQHPELLVYAMERARRNLSDQIRAGHQNTVAHGPFKGLKLAQDAHWGTSDAGAMILGLYEQEILNELARLKPEGGAFIDLGAADGYYGLGVLVAGMFSKSYCFEITEKGRQVIAGNAELNQLQDKIVILGEATSTFYEQVPASDRDGATLLVDIEGAEFDVITPDTFKAFANSVIIIETHEFRQGAREKIQLLVNQSASTHSVRQICTSARDLSPFPELRAMNDTHRWLVCSEGRPYLMSWLRFDPL